MVEKDPAAVLGQELSALAQLGHRYYVHGLYAESARLFEFVLRHEPFHADHYRALGKALHASGQHEQAIWAYSRAVRLGLAEADVHFYMGQCWLYMNQVALAGQALESCLRLAGVHEQQDSPLAQRARQLLSLVQRHQQKMVEGRVQGGLHQHETIDPTSNV